MVVVAVAAVVVTVITETVKAGAEVKPAPEAKTLITKTNAG